MHLPKSFLLWLCISFCSTLPAFSSIVASSITKERGIVVGFLQTEKETYPEELTFSYNITEMLTGLGAHVTRIDYNTIVDFENIRLELLKELGGDISKLRTMEAERIKQEVLSFIKKGV